MVVSDRIRGRPIGFGGEDRAEKSRAMFYVWLSAKQTGGIRRAVPDLWKAGSCGPLRDDESAGWAPRFFEPWRASLKWQRLKSDESFAELIERHWDGIATYGKTENKGSSGSVEGLNDKIRVIQRGAYRLCGAEYLRLRVLTGMLPKRWKLAESPTRLHEAPAFLPTSF